MLPRGYGKLPKWRATRHKRALGAKRGCCPSPEITAKVGYARLRGGTCTKTDIGISSPDELKYGYVTTHGSDAPPSETDPRAEMQSQNDRTIAPSTSNAQRDAPSLCSCHVQAASATCRERGIGARRRSQARPTLTSCIRCSRTRSDTTCRASSQPPSSSALSGSALHTKIESSCR